MRFVIAELSAERAANRPMPRAAHRAGGRLLASRLLIVGPGPPCALVFPAEQDTDTRRNLGRGAARWHPAVVLIEGAVRASVACVALEATYGGPGEPLAGRGVVPPCGRRHARSRSRRRGHPRGQLRRAVFRRRLPGEGLVWSRLVVARCHATSAARSSAASSSPCSQTTSSFIVRITRSTTAFPVGRPTRASVCVSTQRSISSRAVVARVLRPVIRPQLEAGGHRGCRPELPRRRASRSTAGPPARSDPSPRRARQKTRFARSSSRPIVDGNGGCSTRRRFASTLRPKEHRPKEQYRDYVGLDVHGR